MANIALITNNILTDSGTPLTSIPSGSGTTNYLSKWTSSSALGNSLVYDDGTNVGIGTTTFLGKFQVGSGSATQFQVASSGASIYVGPSSGNYNMNITTNTIQSSNSGTTNTYLYIQPNGTGNVAMCSSGTNKVLIGTTTDAGFKLDVNGTTRIVGVATFNNNITQTSGSATFANGIILDSTRRIFGANTITYQSNDAASQHYFKNDISSGLSGTLVTITNGSGTFGTTSASNFLNISGRLATASGTNNLTSILLNHTVENTGTYTGTIRGIYYNPSSIVGTGFTHRAIETTTGDVIFNSTSGSVGIGTTSPGQKLDVNGNIRLSSNSPSIISYTSYASNIFTVKAQQTSGQDIGGMIIDTGNGESRFGSFRLGGGYFTTFYVNNAELIRLSTSNNVLIGTTTDAGYKLDVNGTARINSTLALTSSTYAGTFSFYLSAANTLIGNSSNIGVWLQVGGGNRVYIIGQEFNSTSRGNIFGNTVGGEAISATTIIAQSSGTTATTGLSLRYTINNTGTYVGISRGIYYNPTITSLTGTTHRAIETVTGDVIFGSTSGNVGIGTTSPSYKLDVNGTFRVQGNSSIIATSSSVSSSANAYVYDSTTNYLVLTKRGSSEIGNMGLPAGSVEIGNYNNGALGIWTSSNYIALGSNASEKMRLNISTGNVLIGTTTDIGYKLQVAGNTLVSGVTATTNLNVQNAADVNSNEGSNDLLVYADLTSGVDVLYGGGKVKANIYTTPVTTPKTINPSSTVAFMKWYPTTSQGVFIDYVLYIDSGTEMRSGTVTIVNDTSGNAQLLDTKTADLNGSTANITFAVVNNGGTMEFQVTNSGAAPAYMNILTRYIPTIF